MARTPDSSIVSMSRLTGRLEPVVAPGQEGVAEVVVRVDDREARLAGPRALPPRSIGRGCVLAQRQIESIT